MSAVKLPVGTGVWRAEVSRSAKSNKTSHVFMGDIPSVSLDAGVDVEEFVRTVFVEIEKRGYMTVTVSLACGDILWIDAINDQDGVDVLAVRHNASTFPGGFVGIWVS